ncbi:MAG: molybdopterin molybdotransferase MoeA [Chitinivibrionales bacterium]|nr:molybdopterin molybdotransferase MoeA [Chitinivibrionales bacterium]
MISFDKALETVLAFNFCPETEVVPLAEALNRILAADVVSDVDVPPADLSAMDGFACKKADLDKPLTVVETIPAGHAPQKSIGAAECSRIMTGAVIPAGADMVVMVEHSAEEDGVVRVVKKGGSANIRFKAEDVAAADTVLAKGALITPAAIAVLAAAGNPNVKVYKQPRVGILATGDELVEPSKVPCIAQIRNSNSYQLLAQTLACGCRGHYFGIATDTLLSTETTIRNALNESDVILISGGVSAGDFDFVPAALRKLGVDIKFNGVAMKPGKPTLFGMLGQKAIFGMPGNPVSTFVVFELFVRPFLLKQMGHAYRPLIVKSRILEAFSRKKADRLEFIPVSFNHAGLIVRLAYHGSAHIHAFSAATGIIAIPAGTERIEAGDDLDVRIL